MRPTGTDANLTFPPGPRLHQQLRTEPSVKAAVGTPHSRAHAGFPVLLKGRPFAAALT